jgi:hypothetical protein
MVNYDRASVGPASTPGNQAGGVVAHFTSNNKRIVALAERYKIPAVHPFGAYTSGGGLVSYDTDELLAAAAAAGLVVTPVGAAKDAA